jgi:hypothetical protein
VDSSGVAREPLISSENRISRACTQASAPGTAACALVRVTWWSVGVTVGGRSSRDGTVESLGIAGAVGEEIDDGFGYVCWMEARRSFRRRRPFDDH